MKALTAAIIYAMKFSLYISIWGINEFQIFQGLAGGEMIRIVNLNMAE